MGNEEACVVWHECRQGNPGDHASDFQGDLGPLRCRWMKHGKGGDANCLMVSWQTETIMIEVKLRNEALLDVGFSIASSWRKRL